MTQKVGPAAKAVLLDRLHPAPWNPRTIKDERFQNLVRSIQADPDFLWRRPILATADGAIYAGNMTYRAAQHLGMETVPAIVEQLAKERTLRDNRQPTARSAQRRRCRPEGLFRARSPVRFVHTARSMESTTTLLDPAGRPGGVRARPATSE